jgi:hypothetical protein
LAPDTIVQRNAGVLDAEVDGEAVMLSIDSGRYFGFDSVGTEIWRLVQEPRSIAQICAALLERYDAEPEVCTADVTRFVAGLVNVGTLRVVEPG